MNMLMKWTMLFAFVMLAINNGHAWTIGSKGTMTGTTIHTTYFLTPNNAKAIVHAYANPGRFNNGACAYNATPYDISKEVLQTGDNVYIDGLRLQSLIGSGFNCMTITYTFDQSSPQSFQPVQETFQLVSNGVTYTASLPATAEMTIP